MNDRETPVQLVAEMEKFLWENGYNLIADVYFKKLEYCQIYQVEFRKMEGVNFDEYVMMFEIKSTENNEWHIHTRGNSFHTQEYETVYFKLYDNFFG